jgi:hypothetical protein
MRDNRVRCKEKTKYGASEVQCVLEEGHDHPCKALVEIEIFFGEGACPLCNGKSVISIDDRLKCMECGNEMGKYKNDSLKKPNLDKPAFQAFPEAKDNIEKGICPTCGNPINEKDFKDQSSKNEYGISGMCQTCQDSVFG